MVRGYKECPECGALEGDLHKEGCGWIKRSSTQASPRATVPQRATLRPLKITIKAIPHAEQRYDTCGDYWEDEEKLHIAVSQLADRREVLLVAIHELIEWTLCDAAGISNEAIDKFDMSREDDAWAREPGDCIDAPYYKQHQFASGIERILAAELGVDWLTYERHIEELYK